MFQKIITLLICTGKNLGRQMGMDCKSIWPRREEQLCRSGIMFTWVQALILEAASWLQGPRCAPAGDLLLE